jgi:threonine/homoserine/homoserine lactone efflux protein
MTLMALPIFSSALIADSISPGPTVAALVARVLARGARDALPFLIAIWFGEAIWLTFAIAGLAALAASFQTMFQVIKWAGVGYLLYLAWRLLTRTPDVSGNAEPPLGGRGFTAFMSGLSISLGNPKNMLFYLTLVPSLIDMKGITAAGWLELVLTLVVTLATVDLCWVLLAAKAKALLQDSPVIRRVNQISSGMTALAAAATAVG